MSSRWLTNDEVGTATDPALASKVKQCYNNITVNTNNITLENTDSGVSKTVAVSGGSSSSTIAFNSVSVSGNDLVFGKTDGNTYSEPLNNLTAISDLQTLTTGHTTAIDNIESREQFKTVTQHPDVTDNQMTSGTFTSSNTRYDFSINGINYGFANSSSEGTNYSYKAYQSNTDFWESENDGYHKFETANGAYFDYSGTSQLDGNSGEWLRIGANTIALQPDEGYILSSFTMQANSSKSKPRSFKLFGSDLPNGGYVLLGEYNDVVVSNTDPGTNFKLDSSLANFGTAYKNYFISITKIDAYLTERTVAIQNLKFFSVSKDVSDTIKKAEESVDAITLNFSVQTVGSNDKYFLNGNEAGALPIELNLSHKYIFTFPAAHPLKLSRTSDGTHGGGTEYTGGVTYDSTTQLTFVNGGAYPIENLYYYCHNHANMGGSIIEDNGFNNITSITYDSSVPKLEIERAYHDIYGLPTQDITLSDSFVSAQKDGDNIKLTTITGAQTTVGPFSGGGGGGGTSTTQHPTSAMTSNSLPSPLVAAASTEYNLFTDKLFGDDNLGNIGELSTPAGEISYWGYDDSDGNVILATLETSTGTLRMAKITLSGADVASSSRYKTSASSVASLSDLITEYNSHTGTSHYSFTPHALFDLAVNDSPAYYAFDQDDTTEWVSHSNTYDVTTGNYVGSENLGALTTSGNADDGEFIKLDVGSAITATSITLSSVTEYKEPRINMNDYNQCGYEVTASSENTTNSYLAWYAFDNLRTGSPNQWDMHWATVAGTYSGGVSTGLNNLATGTADGEWVKLKMPDRRKIVAYELSRMDWVDYAHAPKKFHFYASNDNTTWVLLDSQTRGSTDPINAQTSSPNINATSGTRFDLSSVSIPYQYLALVIEETHGTTYTYANLMEFKVICEPSEVENFKLYGSSDDINWTEILHQSTSANITSSGRDFTITNPNSYQHYGLVITKTTGYHNVSLGEMKLGVSQTVNLSEYYKLADWKTLIAACADFAAFKTAVAAL